MSIEVTEIADLEGFNNVRFAFTLPKDDLDLDPDHVDGIMLREQGKVEELYLVGLLQYLVRHYGHRMETAIFEPLLESVVERAEEFGNPVMDYDMAKRIRDALEEAILSRYLKVNGLRPHQ